MARLFDFRAFWECMRRQGPENAKCMLFNQASVPQFFQRMMDASGADPSLKELAEVAYDLVRERLSERAERIDVDSLGDVASDVDALELLSSARSTERYSILRVLALATPSKGGVDASRAFDVLVGPDPKRCVDLVTSLAPRLLDEDTREFFSRLITRALEHAPLDMDFEAACTGLTNFLISAVPGRSCYVRVARRLSRFPVMAVSSALCLKESWPTPLHQRIIDTLLRVPKECQMCGKTCGLKLCNRCHGPRYCSRGCQAADWSAHRSSCSSCR